MIGLPPVGFRKFSAQENLACCTGRGKQGSQKWQLKEFGPSEKQNGN
jgi:hypothetical protein